MGKLISKYLRLTAEQRALADEGWDEIGRSLAMVVINGDKTIAWAWELIKPLNIYPYWMLLYWLKRCTRERRTAGKTGRPSLITKKYNRSIFSSQEEVKDALRMLSDGVNPNDVISFYNKKRNESS
jgi:hypothetical protein